MGTASTLKVSTDSRASGGWPLSVQQVQGFLWAQRHLLPFVVDNPDGLPHELERCHQRASLSTQLAIRVGCEQGTCLTG